MTQATSIQASVLHGVRDLRTETRELPPPSEGELQIAIHSTGICGSDQHYYNHFANGDILVREPLSLGHESSGTVTAIGPSVSGFQVGDRVALEVGVPCEQCKLCGAGRYNICKEMRFRSSAKSFPHFQGTLQEKVNQRAKWCHKLPEGVTFEEGALLEPLSVAIHAIRRAPALKGLNVLVLGAGAVGLLVAAMLRTAEVDKITIADIEGRRVDFAKNNGFSDVGVALPRKRPRSDSAGDKLALAKETAALLMSEGNGSPDAQFDVVFECTGVEACVQTSIYSAATGGAVMLIGMGTPVQTLPVSAAALREVDLIGVFRYASTYEYGLELLANKQKYNLPDVGKLATQTVKGLDKVPEAFALAGKPVDEEGNLVLKVMIQS